MFLDTLEALKHIIWPTRCASCDILLPDPTTLLCPECYQSVSKSPEIASPAHVEHAMALFIYDGAVQSMIAKWKYHEDFLAQKALLSFLPEQVDRLRTLIPDGSCLIPVPPHPKRLRERGFDPVWTFCTRLNKVLKSAQFDVSFRDDVLIRTRHTSHQASLNQEERMHNLEGAFKVKDPGFKADRVILVDDVMTTGATASVCANTLQNANIQHVSFLALAHPLKT